jgi:hypothetical protein
MVLTLENFCRLFFAKCLFVFSAYAYKLLIDILLHSCYNITMIYNIFTYTLVTVIFTILILAKLQAVRCERERLERERVKRRENGQYKRKIIVNDLVNQSTDYIYS